MFDPSRLTAGTATDVSETSDVPRTRISDAIRVLEERGLVETKHSEPEQFRAVSVDEPSRRSDRRPWTGPSRS